MQDFRVSVNDRNEVVHVSPITSHFTDSFNLDKGYRLRRTMLGSCQYDCMDFPEDLSFSDIGKLTVLCRSFLMKGNVLGVKKNKRVRIFKSADEVGWAVGISSKTQSYTFLNRLTECNVVRKYDSKFFVNPAYFIKNGEWLTFELFAMFYVDARALMPASLYAEMFETCIERGLLSNEDYQSAKELMK